MDKEFLKLSFCTVCMNRLMHIRETFIQNIMDNESYPSIEFNLLNYNSNDDMDGWVRDNLSGYLQAGIVKYYHTKEPRYFERSHSRNMIFKLSGGDILCNIDADNFTGKDFAFFVNRTLNQNFQDRMLIRNHVVEKESDRNTFGRICVRKDDF